MRGSIPFVFRTILDSDNVEFIDPQFKLGLITNDTDDNKFVDCAFAANATFIVSQDHHFDVLKAIDFPKIDVIKLQSFVLMLKQ